MRGGFDMTEKLGIYESYYYAWKKLSFLAKQILSFYVMIVTTTQEMCTMYNTQNEKKFCYIFLDIVRTYFLLSDMQYVFLVLLLLYTYQYIDMLTRVVCVSLAAAAAAAAAAGFVLMLSTG